MFIDKDWVKLLFDSNSNLNLLSYKHINEKIKDVIRFINYAINIYKNE